MVIITIAAGIVLSITAYMRNSREQMQMYRELSNYSMVKRNELKIAAETSNSARTFNTSVTSGNFDFSNDEFTCKIISCKKIGEHHSMMSDYAGKTINDGEMLCVTARISSIRKVSASITSNYYFYFPINDGSR